MRTFSKCVTVLAFALVATALCKPATAEAYSGIGNGMPTSPYMITNCSQLQEMNDSLGADYMLANDIDCASIPLVDGINFQRIGQPGAEFVGTLEGNGYTISHVYVENHLLGLGASDESGMFGFIDHATLRDFTLTDSAVSGGRQTGGVVGYMTNSHIHNVTVKNVTVYGGQELVGGIVGTMLYSTLTGSSAQNVTVTGQGVDPPFYATSIGGAVGYAEDSSIRTTWSSGTVAGYGTTTLFSGGGLVGSIIYSNLQDSYSSASVADGFANVGGLVGSVVYSTVERTYATGDVTGMQLVGGLVGVFEESTLNASFSTGQVTGTNDIGGLVGSIMTTVGSITNSFYDAYRSGMTDCVAQIIISVECTAVNTGNATPNYFFNTNTNAPFDAWNFTSIMKTVPGGYPIFSSVPTVPGAIAVTPTTTSLALQWTAPTNSASPITGYRLSYTTSGSNTRTVVDNISPSVLSYMLEDLDPATSYNIRLQAINALGNGEWANFISSTASVIPPVQNPPANNGGTVVTPPSVPSPAAKVVVAAVTTYPSTYRDMPVATTAPVESVEPVVVSDSSPQPEASHTGKTQHSALADTSRESSSAWWWLLILPLVVGGGLVVRRMRAGE